MKYLEGASEQIVRKQLSTVAILSQEEKLKKKTKQNGMTTTLYC